MSTAPSTIEHILEHLGHDPRFTTRAMFGEYALYVLGKTAAFICDDILYLKPTPSARRLVGDHEMGPCYPGSRDYYILTERDMRDVTAFQQLLLAVASDVPEKKKKPHPPKPDA